MITPIGVHAASNAKKAFVFPKPPSANATYPRVLAEIVSSAFASETPSPFAKKAKRGITQARKNTMGFPLNSFSGRLSSLFWYFYNGSFRGKKIRLKRSRR